jgi:hypothetical protein
LAAAREDWRDELVESRELLRELRTEVREMPVDDAQELVSQESPIPHGMQTPALVSFDARSESRVFWA